jgi:hypothetical protein
MKKIFIVSTEENRVRSKVSGSVFKIENEKIELITEFSFSKQMNKGVKNEAVNALIECGELPQLAVGIDGYINYEFKNNISPYDMLIFETKGLSYYSIF